MRSKLLEREFVPLLSPIYDEELANQLAETHAAISSLNQKANSLRNPDLLIQPLLDKEAEASSQLEGTQATLEDAYKLEVGVLRDPEKKNEAQEVANYGKAMTVGIDALPTAGLSQLAIREIHKTLTQGVRGQEKTPGIYRKEEVYIGTKALGKEKARYVPPAAIHIPLLMERLSMFINNRGKVHPLIACAIIHHRFEAIHPFNDGNGRTGRLLISLYLMKEGLINRPVLYPSGYLEEYKEAYTTTLSLVDQGEQWREWVMFFLIAMEAQAYLSTTVGTQIDNLYESALSRIKKEQARVQLLSALDYVFTNPYITSKLLSESLRMNRATADRYLKLLASKDIIADQGIIQTRERLYINEGLITMLKNIKPQARK
jgi:Fic family protein